MTRILLITQFYNEIDNIPELVENIMAQSVRPDTWLLIDDGSTDGSVFQFIEKLREHNAEYEVTRMSWKFHPDANMKGKAWRISQLHESMGEFDYLLKMDVDTRLPEGYIERAVAVMEANLQVGCFSGQVKDEPLREIPCGTGKMVRWSIVNKTKYAYWDLDPDTLWNIKAVVSGNRLMIGDDSFTVSTTRPTQLHNPKGRYQMGRRMAYVRCNTLLVGLRYLKSLKNRTHSWQFLKGYLHEWLRLRNRWRNDDSDVKYFYGLRFQLDLRRGKIHLF
jgi:glycosyltransferase involved in cell wall biosynthesis